MRVYIKDVKKKGVLFDCFAITEIKDLVALITFGESALRAKKRRRASKTEDAKAQQKRLLLLNLCNLRLQ